MIVRFARDACKSGFCVLRFDFVGSGDSEGEFAHETHLTGWLEDLNNALNFLAERPEVDPDRLGAVGLSFGGSTVLKSIGPGSQLKALALWSPVVHLEETFRQTILGEETWKRLQARKTVKNFYGTGFSLDPSFAADAAGYDLMAAARTISLPVLIIQGTDDVVVNPQHAAQLESALAGVKKLVYIEGDDHVFSNKLDEAIRLTIDWFTRHI